MLRVVRQSLRRSLRVLGLLDDSDNFAEGGVFADLLDDDLEHAVLWFSSRDSGGG